MRYLAPLLVFGALVAFLYVGLQRDPRLVPSPLIGKPAPDFVLPRLGEPAATLAKRDLLGQVSLLNVWASWCIACRQEHPLLLEVAKEGTVPIYGLNYKDTEDDAVRWLERLGDPYRASGADLAGKVGLDLGVYGVPETFLIDQNGDIAYKHIGPITPQTWREELVPRIAQLRGGRS